ncbi:MAG: deoxyribodipyrimidine photo-lyase [Vulcanimicrobiaceae bacterium]
MPAHLVETETLARADRNPRRAAYYCGAVSSLAADIAARGARLIVRRDGSPDALAALVAETGAMTVTWANAYDAATVARQRSRRSALEARGVRVVVVHDAPAVAPEDTAAVRADGARGYRALAPFVTAWATQPRPPVSVRIVLAGSPAPSEALPSMHAHARASPDDEACGEGPAGAAFEAYLASGALQYASARDVPGGPSTARLSGALSFGCIAARTVLARIDERGRDPFLLTEEKLALVALTRALAQRDFFLQLAWFFEGAPDRALQARMDGFSLSRDHPALAAWRAGRTGYPLVDAGMRQLRETGWMHPRARLVAASFLCFDLAVDWRVGRDAWDDDLVEDDAALAAGNWQWVAGVGADLAQFPRIYNPRKQARAFDPLGAYVRTYVGELAEAPDFAVARETKRPRDQMRLELFANHYPEPVVDHESAARAYLARYAAFLRASGVRP